MPKQKKSAHQSDDIKETVLTVLEDMKAIDTQSLDVRHLTSLTDTMIVTSGRSDRHVRAMADAIVERCKAVGIERLGVEGTESAEWVLVDLADVIVHLMLPKTRAFYDIEKLWDISRPQSKALES